MNKQNNVQNGTSSLVDAVNSDISITKFSTDRERFLSEYTAFAVKTAKATVEMCRVVYEAKTQLAKYEYLRFLRDIHHSSEDSTIRKYLAIGSLYDKLIQHTNLLPSSWTSIYEITQIPSDVFDALVSTGSSMANLKGAQIKLLKDTSKKSDAATTAADSVAASTAIDATAATAADSVNSDAAATTVDAAAATTTTASTAATTTTDTTAADSVAASTAIDATAADSVAASTSTASIDVTAANCNGAVDSSTSASVNCNTKAQQEDVSLIPNSNSKSNSSKEKTSLVWNVVVSFKKPPSNETYWDLTELIESFYCARNEDIEVDAYEA